ncbi:MAG: hypothetical protein P1U67_09300 [Alcanivoracaceae bacterium]|nr:hypothetical protein [Alcanivoracaceae bacterium]
MARLNVESQWEDGSGRSPGNQITVHLDSYQAFFYYTRNSLGVGKPTRRAETATQKKENPPKGAGFE